MTLHFLVTRTEHLVEGGYFASPSLLVRRFLEITLGSSITNDAFAIQPLFQAANGAVHRFSFADFDFYGHEVCFEKREKIRKRGKGVKIEGKR